MNTLKEIFIKELYYKYKLEEISEKKYRTGGNRQKNIIPVWVAFSYLDLGTVTMMYNYLRGDLRKAVLTYSFGKSSYAKKDTEILDTWLDAVRNL